LSPITRRDTTDREISPCQKQIRYPWRVGARARVASLPIIVQRIVRTQNFR
jgi:hypothetical protein